MPQVEGPKELNRILESAYSSAIASGKSKESASKISWSAAKNKYRKKGESWVRKLYDDLNIVILASQKVVNASPKHTLAKNVDYLLFAIDKMSKFMQEDALGKIDAPDDVEWLDMNTVLTNPYNREVDRNKVDGIKQSIQETNSVKPVVYSEIDKDGKKANMITDGHHRYIALKELGYSQIPARLSDENGLDTTAEDDKVKLKKEISTAEVQGLELVRQDLAGKPKKPNKKLEEAETVAKGGPGSGRNPENPLGRTDDLDSQIARHKADLKTGKIKLEQFKQRVEPLYALKQRTGHFSAQTTKPINVPFGINKGGEGSGSWEAPGQPRFPHAGNKEFKEPFHSSNHVKQFLASNNVLIGSVDRTELSPEKNELRQKEFESYLQDKGIPYKVAQGNYEGSAEKSYIISTPEKEQAEKLHDMLSRKYKQDSVVHVRSGHATLQHKDGNVYHANINDLKGGDLTSNYTEVDGLRFQIPFKF